MTIRVAIAGLGTVGQATANLLPQGIILSAYSVRDPAKTRGIDVSAAAYEAVPANLATRNDVDMVVELMGGANGAAYDLAKATLQAGKPFITANKAMLATHWDELFALSVKHSAPLLFEASVAGGIPIIKTLREALAGNQITAISGILNGTCNYILTAMYDTGASFDEALQNAQNLGYAEADPTFDIDGIDAAQKLLILAKLSLNPNAAFGDITCTGIRNITASDITAAKLSGHKIRLIATATQNSLTVSPQVIPPDHPFYTVNGVLGAIHIDANPLGGLTLIGAGAGGGAAASSVLADIVDAAKYLRKQ